MGVNRKTGKGLTPLHLAAKRNHLELVEFLLKRKANPLNTNHRSQTAAMMASDSEVKAILSAAELEARAKQPMPSAAAEEVEDSQEAPGAAPPARPEAPSNDAEKATAPGPSAASDGGVQNGEQGVVTEGAASAGSLFRKRKAATAAIRPPGASDKIGVRGRGRGRIVPPGAKPS